MEVLNIHVIDVDYFLINGFFMFIFHPNATCTVYSAFFFVI